MLCCVTPHSPGPERGSAGQGIAPQAHLALAALPTTMSGLVRSTMSDQLALLGRRDLNLSRLARKSTRAASHSFGEMWRVE
jgi:hypothetical protein